MDVGLSNKNYLGLVAPELANVKFIVECDGSHDQFNLWREYAPKSSSNITPLDDNLILKISKLLDDSFLTKKIKELNEKVKYNNPKRVDSWEEVSSGFMLEVGKATFGDKTLPICVSFSFAYINGVKVCFYYECSQARNSKLVEDWFRTKFQLTHDNYTRWNHVDANNFHNCVNSLDRLDVEPRELDTITLLTPRAIVTNWYPKIPFKTGAVLTKVFGNPPSRNDMTDDWRYWDEKFDKWIWAESLEDAKANFRKLDWWEKRTEEEMPTHVKLGDGTIAKVLEHNFDNFFDECLIEKDNKHTPILYKDCVPANADEIKTIEHAEV